MGDYGILFKAIESLGSTGILGLVIWKLVDKWAGQFLAVQEHQTKSMSAQAEAMCGLADSIRDSAGEQREVLMAMRVMAKSQEDTKDWIRELAERLRGAK
jgi:hypothetical protein